MEALSEYLEARNPDPARRVGSRIRETIDLLLKFPNLGHKGAQPGTREMLVPRLPYIIVYRIERDADEEWLAIAGVYHGAQRRPGRG
jgi:toxin ParE1/3/4